MVVLDTHALIWWVSQDSRLSKTARKTIEEQMADGKIIISSISTWEIALLVEREKLVLSMDVASWISTIAMIKNVHFYPVDNDIAIKSVHLPGDFHKDPADRMIVATARKLAAPLITKDEKILGYSHVKTIW